MKIKSTEIVDTYAEAFKMWGCRIVITAATRQWADAAARSMTGFATSVIGCKCEAGIERELSTEETPDRRPGISVLLFTPDKDSLGKRLVERVGQCVMTCPTTACFNGLDGNKESVIVGGQLRYFGDGFQISKKLNGRRLWRIPVMDGEFVVDESFSIQPAVGGGNILLLGTNQKAVLRAAKAAAKAMREVAGIILPFPDGVVRSGSKVGSKYKSLIASTNDAYCPTLRGATASSIPEAANAVLEIVIDGLDVDAVSKAMRAGLHAAVKPGIKQITAGNYGGNLGQFKINLKDLVD